jgi:hypothetical protein
MDIDPDLYESPPQPTSHPLYPVMLAECERVFSGAKLLISPNRNRLADDIIEAAECLRIWWMRGIIEE